MHPIARAATGLVAAATIIASQLPSAGAAYAGADLTDCAPLSGGDAGGTCPPTESGGGVNIGIGLPGHNRHTSPGKKVATGGKATAKNPNDCSYQLMVPQPAIAAPNDTTGAFYLRTCTGPNVDYPLLQIWLPNKKTATKQIVPRVTPAQAAQQALATLRLPKPGVHRSPPETNLDAGTPYTWVNLWTWYWSTPASWKSLSKTVKLPGVSATVKAVPEELTFDPGDGSAAVTCDGPGRAWTAADGDGAPTSGGCAYAYKHVSDGVRAKVSIRWGISWTGTGGVGGDLPDLNTTTTSPSFKVEQIQVVNR